MNIRKIHYKLLLKGVDSYSSWLGKSDGAYMICRPYNSKSNEAKAYLIPIDDECDNDFIKFIVKEASNAQRNE